MRPSLAPRGPGVLATPRDLWHTSAAPTMRPRQPETAPRADTLLVLRTGDAVAEVAAHHGEFARWIAEATGDAWPGRWHEHDARGGGAWPDVHAYAGVVVTGSSASVTERAPWMLDTERWLRDAVEAGAAVLGICFGHQLLAQALGGEVQKNPRGREIGSVELTVAADDLLFEGLPPRFVVNATHLDTVAALPPGARSVATTALESHAVLSFAPRVRGVQFHPEICAAKMRGYLAVRRGAVVAEGLDADALVAQVVETPLSAELLRNFVRHFVGGQGRRPA